MIILSARVEGTRSLTDTCFEAVELCNRIGVGIDLLIGDHRVEVRPGMHPYNLERAWWRAARASEHDGA